MIAQSLIPAELARTPTPDELAQYRARLRLTQRKCAELVHVSLRSWEGYESPTGKTRIPLGTWELFLIKSGSLWLPSGAAK